MIGIFLVGSLVYYVQNEKLLGVCSLNELGNTTQTTVIVEVENEC